MNIDALPEEVMVHIFWMALAPAPWPWSCLNFVSVSWKELCVSRQRRMWFVEHSTISKRCETNSPSLQEYFGACAKYSIASEAGRSNL